MKEEQQIGNCMVNKTVLFNPVYRYQKKKKKKSALVACTMNLQYILSAASPSYSPLGCLFHLVKNFFFFFAHDGQVSSMRCCFTTKRSGDT